LSHYNNQYMNNIRYR